MQNIRAGVIGLGNRGYSLLTSVVLNCHDVTVTAVCDLYEDRIERGAKAVEDKFGVRPACYTDYKQLIDDENVDVVLVLTAWEAHIDPAVYAMNAGKPTALEVGGAYSLKDCWKLVETQEQTGVPFMFLENCCFGRREMMVLNMVEQGLLGEVVHCSGCYAHDLRHEVAFGNDDRHYRLRNYLNRNCENYPTHELGPIAKVLKINNGNRIVSLTSTSSKAAGLKQFIADKKSDDTALMNATFQQGDVVTTVLKCAHGETIVLTLDTTLPRYYSRGFTVRGTKGLYEECTDSVFLDRKEDIDREWAWRADCNGNAKEYEEQYDHPVWKQYLSDGVQGGHDGMDWLEFNTFFDCLREGKEMPVNVYDAATWMSITALSEQSIANGSAPVAVPDFTRGKWVL